MSKSVSDDTKNTKVNSKNEAKPVFVNGIIGIMLLLVVGSITCMTAVIWTGTDNQLLKLTTVPAALFAVGIGLVAFSKILK